MIPLAQIEKHEHLDILHNATRAELHVTFFNGTHCTPSGSKLLVRDHKHNHNDHNEAAGGHQSVVAPPGTAPWSVVGGKFPLIVGLTGDEQGHSGVNHLDFSILSLVRNQQGLQPPVHLLRVKLQLSQCLVDLAGSDKQELTFEWEQR